MESPLLPEQRDVDATGLVDGSGPLRVLREGVITREQLEAAVPEAFVVPEREPEEEPDPEPADEPVAGTDDA